MSNVEMFKYYASKLNLSKPQLETVTDCFKACFEADCSTGSEPNVDKQPDETVPSESRKQHASFQDNNMWGAREMQDVLNTKNARLAKTMNGVRVPRVNRKDEEDLWATGRDVVNGNFHNIVSNEENRQAERERVMRMQKTLNKTLGINLAVDGILGPQTKAALKQYREKKAAAQTPTPQPPQSAGTDWHQQSPQSAGPNWRQQDVQAYHEAQSGQHRW